MECLPIPCFGAFSFNQHPSIPKSWICSFQLKYQGGLDPFYHISCITNNPKQQLWHNNKQGPKTDRLTLICGFVFNLHFKTELFIAQSRGFRGPAANSAIDA